MTTRRECLVGAGRTMAGVLASETLGLGAKAFADEKYPQKPVKIIVPAPPGVAPDVLARLYANQLEKQLGQAFVIDNRTGASGNLGADAVMRSRPDGYTLMYSHNSLATVNSLLFPTTGLDFIERFSPIGRTIQSYYVLLGSPKLKANSLSELIAEARKPDHGLAYASYGPGTIPHLVLELIQERTGIQLLQVPYRTSPIPDVIAGHVGLVLEPLASGLPMVTSGKLKGLAVSSPSRLPALPAVPAMNEALPGMAVPLWHGFWAPKGTPAAIVQQLNMAANNIGQSAVFRAHLTELACEPLISSPEEMNKVIFQERESWSKVIKDKNIRLE